MAAVDLSFWRGRRVLVTGHTGFKGAWLSLWLQEMGSDVVGLSRSEATPGSLFEAAGVDAGMTSVRADVLDSPAVAAAVAEHRPEVVVHLAGQPLLRSALGDPAATFAANVLGTTHLLDAVRRTPGVRAVLCVTTDKVYEPRVASRAQREDDPLAGHDPYSASKACAELVAGAYRRSFFADGGPHLATARTGNLLGGGDAARDRLVPDLLRAAMAGEPVELRAASATRSWLHVLDALHGYLLLLERLWEDETAARAWNFGPGPDAARSVGWLADRVAALWGADPLATQATAGDPAEASHVRLDASLARTRLGWAPRLDLDTALQSVVHFARADQAGEDLREVALAQLDAFVARGAPAAATRRAETAGAR